MTAKKLYVVGLLGLTHVETDAPKPVFEWAVPGTAAVGPRRRPPAPAAPPLRGPFVDYVG